jgi:glucose-6-phosphate 1-dehydrogenase
MSVAVTTDRPGPQVLVLFGATGDLAKRKLFPGLYHLAAAGRLPADYAIVGSGRNAPGSDDEFRQQVRDGLVKRVDDLDDEVADDLISRVSFCASTADDGADLAAAVQRAEELLPGEVSRLLYLSVPPNAMEPMIAMLGREGLTERGRLVVEKPFGTDLESARALEATLHGVVDEAQVFRIDHFLGKESVQNILALRFANGLFEPAWNAATIASVQIDVPEELTIEGRGHFYESTGAFRDMITTHLCQLLGFIALEPPVKLDANQLRDEKAKVFAAMRPLDPDSVVFGQYQGYRDEDSVADDSGIETFVAVEAYVDNWRWSGVPFYLRTGKALAQSRRTITLTFRTPPLLMFPGDVPEQPNQLVLELTDDAHVRVDIRAKRPGPSMQLAEAALRLDFAQEFSEDDPLEAYERLLLDVMRGDQTLFTRSDEVLRLWEVCQPVLDAPPPVQPYERGSWGPAAALALPHAGRGRWYVGG